MRLALPERRHLPSTMQDYGRSIVDGTVIVISLLLTFWLISDLDLFNKLYEITRPYDGSQLDEIVIVILLSVVGLVLFGVRRLQDQRWEIERRCRAEDRAQQLALADTLTGLPNRRQFQERLAEALEKIKGNDGSIALMMIDLDRFKPVNDVFGHAIGDEVLVAFAKRASAVAGPAGILARFGGDEFAFLPGPNEDPEELARIARRLLGVFERPFDVGEIQVTLGASIGIATAPRGEILPEEIMRWADIALYRAKASGRGNFRFFETEMDAEVKKRAQIERDLRQAIKDGTVGPYYQPIIDLNTGWITGFEALARWQHPVFGRLDPEQFIGIAEDGGLIIPLASHLLREAAQDAIRWPAHIKLCFNISRVQLSDPMMVLRILQILGETGLSPTRLEVEISEQALVSDIVAAKQAFEALHHAGVRIALDDFGTGNSSLQHLRACHFDRLKIDRSFVVSMAGSDEKKSVINAILGLSKAFGLPVTAEGIEDDALIDPLRNLGCSEGQGFHFNEALPPEGALRLLMSESPSPVAAAGVVPGL